MISGELAKGGGGELRSSRRRRSEGGKGSVGEKRGLKLNLKISSISLDLAR